jgi:regulator of protease activity HflC (stomatin/prohibitin superfamily)
MRIDHFAYQQATRVSGFGLILQLVIGLLVLIFARVQSDTTLTWVSLMVLTGALAWIALVITFHQHRLERLEELETEELAATRGDRQSVFEAGAADARVAARRLELMHRVLVPAASMLMAGAYTLLAWRILGYFEALNDPKPSVEAFRVATNGGWMLAGCAFLALLCFVFSRWIAGMASLPAWQNLRGGAGVMVGNAIVLLAVAVGVALRYVDQPTVLERMAQALPFLLFGLAGEIVLNFVLNLYRPRRLGEIPRAAFDSKVLGLLAAPDSIVRGINEAVNYQFGFDITSSWGYQLLLRNVAKLGAIAAILLVAMSMVVVVGPGEQAVRLRGGRVVGDVSQGELVLKWPWPIETVEIWPVATVRSVQLGPKSLQQGYAWASDQPDDPERKPFIVSASTAARRAESAIAPTPVAGEDDAAARSVSTQFALVNADIVLNYRVRPTGLIDFLSFASEARSRRSPLTMRERALRAISLREATQFLATQPLDRVLSPDADSLGAALKGRIQAAFDAESCGVEVVSVLIPALRPPGESAGMFEELSIDTQNARKVLDEAQRVVNTTMAAVVGGTDVAREAVAAIERLRAAEREHGIGSAQAAELRRAVESILLRNPAQASSLVAKARARRWEVQLDASRNASEVAGQSAAFRAAPELYRQRRTMDVLGEQLARARMKYVIGADPGRVRMHIEMQEPESGLNLGDYLTKDGESGN